jgi:crotonobetainyl-CoA:carnitine CoA-transferase CaiB-like acyl-CoA transferase
MALAGVKVLDLSRVLAGPWATQILGDLGADVIKIESPQGDDTRQWGPPFMPPATEQHSRGDSAYYLCANRNKRSVAINIACAKGAALVRELAKTADVFIENFKVGGLSKYGLDEASIRAINPKIVYCSITGFGQTGPYADRPGYDFVVQGMGGLMSLTGTPDTGPLRTGVAVTDLSTGLYAVIAILAALRHAERTGQGQHLDVSLLDTQVSMLANQSLNYLVSHSAPKLIGNTHPTIVPYQVFETSDRPMIIAVGNDAQFKALCELLHTTWHEDERFATNRARVTHREILVQLIQDTLKTQNSQTLMEALINANIPAGPVNQLNEVFDDPQVKHRQMQFEMNRPIAHHPTTPPESIPQVGFPVKLNKTPARYRHAPPTLSQDCEQVLKEWLTLSSDEIKDLIEHKIIQAKER